jgi:hypothetical protein
MYLVLEFGYVLLRCCILKDVIVGKIGEISMAKLSWHEFPTV